MSSFGCPWAMDTAWEESAAVAVRRLLAEPQCVSWLFLRRPNLGL